jgi:hypothetical protein
MFCSHCGNELIGTAATGNFCTHCGTKLAAAPATLPITEALAADWSSEHRYETLLRYPEVRAQIERAAAECRTWLTGEQCLKLTEKAFEPLMGVSLGTVNAIALPIARRLNFQTGKSRSELCAAPLGQTIVAALCSLARHGRKLTKVHQAEDGCVLEAELPPDLRASTTGELLITIRRSGNHTQVEAATKIPGQLYDWGKSKGCLNQLFSELVQAALRKAG